MPLQIRSRLDTLETVQAELSGAVDQNIGNTSALLTAINLKAPKHDPVFSGTVRGITKAMVNLSNVDDTSDSAKPISTATQTALNLKAP